MDNISNSNIKLILEFYFKNFHNYTINDIYNFYKPTQGFLYCLYNEIFKFYGDDLYKCGNSVDTDKRLSQYTTSYPVQSDILLTSDNFFDKSFAETLLFYYLKDFKFKPNREFIKCDFNIIKDAFDKVKHFFSIYHNKQLLIDYLIKDKHYKHFFKPIHNISKKHIIIKYDFNNDVKHIYNILQFDNNILFYTNNDFITHIYKYLFKLNFEQFQIFFKYNYTHFGKYKFLLDNMNSLYWLEKIIGIQRLQINDIDTNINIDFILQQFINNIDYFVAFFKKNEAKNKTINAINNKIFKIKNTYTHTHKFNLFKKFIADIYNTFYNDLIKIERKEIHVKKTYKGSIYLFKY